MRSVGLLRYLVEHIPVDWNSVNGNAIGMAMRTVEAKRFKDALLDQIEDSGSFPSVEDLKSRVGLGDFDYSPAEFLTMCVQIVRLCGIGQNSTVEDLLSLLKFLSGFGRQVTSVYQIT
ncbi:hypothetical protein GPALN_013219 [Globodera pallida]|nr:hypothetical protein GPALN_013219 [Globodera pallida]